MLPGHLVLGVVGPIKRFGLLGRDTAILGTANHGLVPQLADLGEDLVDIALAVHDVNEPGQTRPDGLEDLQGGADAEQPLETLLLLDGQVAHFVVALLPELRTHPEVQVADAEQTAEGIQEQGGV